MKILFVNIPNTKRDQFGNLQEVGPQAGSRWPWTGMRPGVYAPMPFYMCFAATYLQAQGIDAQVLDMVAERLWHPTSWHPAIAVRQPDIVVYEVSRPVLNDVLGMAQLSWSSGKKVVLCGPHTVSEPEALAKLPYVDHVIVGEYELPMLAIAQGSTEKIFKYQHVEDLDTANGKPWFPYRDLRVMAEYYEPTINTPKVQLTVMTSRGCFAKCSYCAWPKTMNNRTYRARSAAMVIAEIKDAIEKSRNSGRTLSDTYLRPDKNEPTQHAAVRSILFDDDTAFIGVQRTIELCDGLDEIGLPWSAMTRLDIHKPEMYDRMFNCGAVAIRAGVESFQQHVVDRTNGSRNCQKQYEALRYITGRYRGIEIHLTSMRDMPGQTEKDWDADQVIFKELKARAEQHGNQFHWQISRTMPFPGTDLYNQMVEAGHQAVLDTADYNGTQGETELNRVVRNFIPLTVKKAGTP